MAEFLFRIDHDSSVPLYRQVQNLIVEAIGAGALGPMRKMPSSRELAESLEVSRNTINLAYQELIAQGLLISQERRGVFITPDLTPAQIRELSDHSVNTEGISELPSIDWRMRLRPALDAGLLDLNKPTDWARYPYPFLPGQIELSKFPARAWNRCLREALFQPHLAHSLQDAAGAEDEMLVEAIRTKLLPSRGVHAKREEILITLGTQHGLDLVAAELLHNGSKALVEDPGYLDTRHILMRHGAAIGNMPVAADGAVIPDDLTGVDLLFLTPSHHHPTNVTMSMDKRRAVISAAAAAGTVIIEDDYDAEFRYSGQPSPALKAMAQTGDVVHLGSFSKFLAPGLRLGFLVGPPALVEALRHRIRYTVRHVPGLIQRAMALFLDSGDYHRTLRLNRERMRRKFALMCEGVREHMPFSIDPFPPGGVSLWIQGPPELDARKLQTAAAQHGVLVEPGDVFFSAVAAGDMDSGSIPSGIPGAIHYPRATFRLGYSSIPTNSIKPGLEALGTAISEVMPA